MDVRTDVEVSRPAGEVFEYLADAENMPRWMKAFTAVEKLGDGPIGPGTEFRYLDRRGIDSTFEWSVYRPASELAWHGARVKAIPGGSFEPDGYYALHEHDGQTHVEMHMKPQLRGTAKLFARFWSRSLRKANDEYMSRLKDDLEGRGS
jgi:uncharacterized membrane protein